MQAEKIRRFAMAALLYCCVSHTALSTAFADGLPGTPAATNAPATPPQNPADLLTWDSVLKDQETKPGQATADFFFAATNSSTTDVVIDHVQTSCGCTVAKLPSQPWTLKPGENGKINVSVNLQGKSGTFFKTITVFFPGTGRKDLTVKVAMPDSPEMARVKNQQMATADRQHVFKEDCARCHSEPARGKTGQELYAAACGICHDAKMRASAVPDLHALNHSTDKIYWRQWISTGKEGSMMPAFSPDRGGPLSVEQIESLVSYLDETIPHNPKPAPAAQLNPPKLLPVANAAAPPLPPAPAGPK